MITKYLLKVAMLGSTWVMYLLIALSVLSIGAMVERWWFFKKRRQGGDELGDQLTDLLEHGDHAGANHLLQESPTLEAEIVRKAIKWVRGGPEALEAGIEGEMAKKRKELERGMNLLGTLGSNAPFIGLLGTVIGVIEAFAHLGEGQDKAAMGNVMAGIAEALVATGVGLFVAIPAVIAYNVFQKKVGDVEENVTAISRQLCALLNAARTTRTEMSHASIPPKEIKAAAESMRELALHHSSRDVSAAAAEAE